MTVYINICLNIEAGAERSLLYGDEGFEDYMPPIPLSCSSSGKRHFFIEEWFEYGLNIGLPQLLDLFYQYNIEITLFICGRTIEVVPSNILDRIKLSPHEVAGHGYRWINYYDLPREEEKKHINKTVDLIENTLNKPCHGWYTGRRSQHTHQFIADLNMNYSSDYYGNIDIIKKMYGTQPLFLIPYTLYTNDINLLPVLGGQSDNDFLLRLKNQLNCLRSLKRNILYTIGLHERISGIPGRLNIIREFIEYAQKYNVVFCSRNNYLNTHFLNKHPPPSK